MNKTIDALKLAEEASNRVIETLEYLKTIGIHSDSLAPAIRAEKKALAAIREALAEPVKQEPVAMVVSKCGDPESFGERELEVLIDIQALPYDTPFYASPVSAKREWVDLTDDELLNELKVLDASTARLPIGFKLFARAVIAAFKEKNK